MVDVVATVLRFLHIVFGIAWIGGIFFSVGVLRTAMARVDPDVRKKAMRQLIPIVTRYIPGSAILTIVFGFLLYSYLGGLNADVMLGTPWGQTIFAAFLITLGTFVFGITVVIEAANKMRLHLEEEQCPHVPEVGGLQKAFTRGQFVVLALGLIIIGLMVAA